MIDTNVLAHACNADSQWHESALAIVEHLIDADTKLALDDTGKNAPAVETSYLYTEYDRTLPPGSISRVLLQALADFSRLDFHLRPNPGTWRKCKALVPANHVDAIVLGIATMTATNMMVSNDYTDFPEKVRKDAAKSLGVDIACSDEFAEERI